MEDNFIFESPDNGKKVYRRIAGGSERELISSTDDDLFTYLAYNDIKKLSETNASIKKALDNLLLIYYTIKDDKDTP